MTGTKEQAGENLADRVIRYLIEHIRRNKLTWGTQVPSEVKVSSELNVSRGIVREAYRALRTAGILEITNGRSPRVGRLDNRSLIQFLQHALSTAQASPDQVFDVRSSIEVRAAELAAEKRTDEDADALMKEVAAMRAAGRQRERFVRADLRFHEIIGRATGNPLFGLMSNALRTSLDFTIRAGFDSRRSRAELNRVVQIHEGLAEAIVRGDRAKARRLMAVHFEEARDFVIGRSAAPTPKRAARRAKAPTGRNTR